MCSLSFWRSQLSSRRGDLHRRHHCADRRPFLQPGLAQSGGQILQRLTSKECFKREQRPFHPCKGRLPSKKTENGPACIASCCFCPCTLPPKLIATVTEKSEKATWRSRWVVSLGGLDAWFRGTRASNPNPNPNPNRRERGVADFQVTRAAPLEKKKTKNVQPRVFRLQKPGTWRFFSRL